ncbi:Fic family protein [Candidatus Microthrix parvicella]|uniref:Fic family protein n=1 Tax=Candidatus Neomicrothrix parvicella TaxID=41950 RepID=UPI00037429A6|nr:Fic family protein [Candidatus Microthrix parvicella]
MQVKRFENSPTGKLVPIDVEEGGRRVQHVAFVPAPLPAALDLEARTWSAAVNAAHHLGRLDALARELLPNPMLVARPTIRREAVSTSALEGTFARAAEVLSSEIDEDLPRSQAVTEVINFIRATEQGIERRSTLPISTRFACELQHTLLAGTPSEDWQTGKIRQTQVLIGPYKGCSVLEASYIPPPADYLADGLTAWETWIHDDNDLHPIVRVAAAHYQFEALHPFTDGNGRIGRLIAILQLIDYDLLTEPLLNLSPYFEVRSDKYRHLLREVSIRGAWDEWISFFCEALSAQASDAESRIRSLLAWRRNTMEMLRANRVKGVALTVTEKLIEFPTLTVKHISKAHGVSPQAANNAAHRLMQLGVLEEVTGRSYNRVFQATEVFSILFRSPDRPEPGL